MKVIHKNQTEKFKNSDSCTAIEYPLEDKDIDGAVVELVGRYPEKGRVVNLKCKELSYIVSGSGKIVVEGHETVVQEGDLVLINPKERYFWDGNIVMFISCNPVWQIDQHKKVE